MNNEKISVTDLIKARNGEIKEMEQSLLNKKKQSLCWQRIPFYKRRRSKNYDIRTTKKKKQRHKDRHFLRTHTFFCKRFFMLSLNEEMKLSIPYTRRVKSSKFIYKNILKSQFVFDETFKGVFSYESSDNCEKISGLVDLDSLHIDKSSNKIFTIGFKFTDSEILKYNLNVTSGSFCSLLILSNNEMDRDIEKAILGYQIFNINNHRELLPTTFPKRIICDRKRVMELLQLLISFKVIPISFDEYLRICSELQVLSELDLVNNSWFQIIYNLKAKEIIEKYNRTPKGKRDEIIREVNFEEYPILSNEKSKNNFSLKYFLFTFTKKGTANTFDYIKLKSTDQVIGRVIRSNFRYSIGKVEGLGFIYDDNLGGENILSDDLIVVGISRDVGYHIKTVKCF